MKVIIVYPEENFCLNACVFLRCEDIEATVDPSIAEFNFAKGLAKVKLGGAC